jgi:hypothetical protein
MPTSLLSYPAQATTNSPSVSGIFRPLPVSTHLVPFTHPSPMLSRARTIFCKLHGRGSQSAPSKPAPATTTESEPAGPPPRAMHISDVRRSPTPTYRRPFPNQTPMSIIIADATGASVDLYKVRTYLSSVRVEYHTSSPPRARADMSSLLFIATSTRKGSLGRRPYRRRRRRVPLRWLGV